MKNKSNQKNESIQLACLEEIKIQVSSPVEEVRVAALKEALKYGEAGLDLVIQALRDESAPVKWALYMHFYEIWDKEKEPENYNNHHFFECFCTLDGSPITVKSLNVYYDEENQVIRNDDSKVKGWDFQKMKIIHTENHNYDVDNYEFVVLTEEMGLKLLICSRQNYKTVVWDWHAEEKIHSSEMVAFDLEYEWDHTNLYLPTLKSVNISRGSKVIVINYSYDNINGGGSICNFSEVLDVEDIDSCITVNSLHSTECSWYLYCYLIAASSSSIENSILLWNREYNSEDWIKEEEEEEEEKAYEDRYYDDHTLELGEYVDTDEIMDNKDFNTVKVFRTLKGHSGRVTCLDREEMTNVLISGSEDKTIKCGIGRQVS